MSIIVIYIVCVITASTFSFKPLLNKASNSFGSFIAEELDKAEQERMEKIANGEIVTGKDTVLIWGNKYEIAHCMGGKELVIYTNGLIDLILENVIVHKNVNDNLYIISKEGYAVIDKNNLCKVYVTVPEDEFVNGYTLDEQGNKSYISRYIENDYIQYLSGFDGFSENEQKIFKELQKRLGK